MLEGNKVHLLSQARSELHVEPLNKCFGDLQKRMEAQRRAPQDVQNEFVESRREQTLLQEELLRKEKAFRDTQIRRKHEMGKMKRAQVQLVDELLDAKIQRKSRDYSTVHIPVAANARTDEFFERFWRIPGC